MMVEGIVCLVLILVLWQKLALEGRGNKLINGGPNLHDIFHEISFSAKEVEVALGGFADALSDFEKCMKRMEVSNLSGKGI